MTEQQLRLESTVHALVSVGNDATAVDTIKAEIEAGTSSHIIADALTAALGAARDAGPIGCIYQSTWDKDDAIKALTDEGIKATTENLRLLLGGSGLKKAMEDATTNAGRDAMQTVIWNTFHDEEEVVL